MWSNIHVSVATYRASRSKRKCFAEGSPQDFHLLKWLLSSPSYIKHAVRLQCICILVNSDEHFILQKVVVQAQFVDLYRFHQRIATAEKIRSIVLDVRCLALLAPCRRASSTCRKPACCCSLQCRHHHGSTSDQPAPLFLYIFLTFLFISVHC